MEWTERQKELRHMIHEAVGELPVNKMNYEGYGGHDVTLGVRLPNRCHPSVNWDVDDGHFLIEASSIEDRGTPTRRASLCVVP